MGKEDVRYIQTQTHTQMYTIYIHTMGFPGGLVIKNTSVHARDMSLIPGLRRSPGKGAATYSSFPAWENPQTEEPAVYSPWGHKRVGHDLATKEQQMSIIPP